MSLELSLMTRRMVDVAGPWQEIAAGGTIVTILAAARYVGVVKTAK